MSALTAGAATACGCRPNSRADGTFTSWNYPAAGYRYSLADDVLTITFTNCARPHEHAGLRGKIYEWAADGSVFRLRIEQDFGSVRTEGWEYEYRRQP